MDQAKPVSTPVDGSAKRVKTGEDEETFDQVKYQSAVSFTCQCGPDQTSRMQSATRPSSKPMANSLKSYIKCSYATARMHVI